MPRATIIVFACLALGVAACGDDDTQQATGTNAVGAGSTCQTRLKKDVTTEYLRQRGIGIVNERAAQQQLAAAITQVCNEGPADRPRSAGAERVVKVIEAQYLPPE